MLTVGRRPFSAGYLPIRGTNRIDLPSEEAVRTMRRDEPLDIGPTQVLCLRVLHGRFDGRRRQRGSSRQSLSAANRCSRGSKGLVRRSGTPLIPWRDRRRAGSSDRAQPAVRAASLTWLMPGADLTECVREPPLLRPSGPTRISRCRPSGSEMTGARAWFARRRHAAQGRW